MSWQETETETVLEMAGLDIAPGDRIGSYVYVRPVGKGGMATVVLARDPNDQEVALKILKASRFGTGMVRFRREFRALSRIRHPNVIRVDAYGDIRGHPFIAMEYVEGRDLHQTIRSFRFLEDPDERWKRCEAILVDTCKGLAHVHAKGLVHRDMKPSNVLIGPDGRCKLTDFGIVKDLDPDNDGFQSGTLVGTWAYASPEQISGRPIDHRSDLYSLGIILFAMLTGCRPFDEKDLRGYLEAHRNKIPPRPRQYEARCPKHLDEICWKLLQKKPADRFQSAREILYRLEQLEERRHDTLDADWQPPLVGRGAERDILLGAVDRLTRSEGGMVVVEGRAGEGRTRLLETAGARAAAIGIPVHRIDAHLGEGGLFGLIEICREVVRDLGEEAPQGLRDIVREFRSGKARGDALYRLVDQLRPALMTLLRRGPRVILYDDFHAVPPRGIELVATLVRTLIAVGEPLLLLVAVRSEHLEGALERMVRGEELGLTPAHTRLEPLSRPAVGRMVSMLLGRSDKATVLADRLHAETQGNPMFLAQFLESLIHSGMMVTGLKGRLEITADTEEIRTGHLEIPSGVRSVLRQRLENLSAGEIGVLRALAVSARPLELDLLLDVLGGDEDEVLDHLDALIDRGVVVERRAGDLVHHSIRHRLTADVVYRDLGTEERALLHRKLAVALEANFASLPAAIELVGDHYRLAGEAGKAYQYLAAAAARMVARSLPHPAWELSNRAVAVEDLASVDLDRPAYDDARLELLRARQEVLYIRGEWEDCQKTSAALVRLADITGEALVEVQARATLARVLLRLDRADTARDQAELALTRARKARSRAAVAEALFTNAALAWDEGDLDAVERLASEGMVLTTEPELAGLRADLMLAHTASQASKGQLALAAKGLEEATAIFKDLGQKAKWCVASGNLAELYIWQGRLTEALACADASLRGAEAISYAVGRAAAVRVRGEAWLELGRIPDARRDLQRGLELAKDLGVVQESIACRYALARLCAMQGDPAQTESHVAIARNLARKRDPERYNPALVALNAWACAMTGDLRDAERMLEVAEKTLHTLPVPRRAQVLLGCARAHSALGRTTDGERLTAQAAALARSRGLRLLELECRLLQSKLVEDPAQAKAWREEAARLARAFDGELRADLADAFWSRPGLSALR
ncbi:MAG: protein kinase [Proteobacteria bacterium]|nr:protein kinase [Pseudomonadota bacterium]MCP4915388.1 protein kinase [Pseudomonadota bacterium]